MASSSQPIFDPLAEALRENHELRSALAASAEQLQQFLYAASHDLQEPLRGIIAYAQLLDRQFASDPAVHEYTTFLLGSALRMRELLQHLLVYSRAGASKRRLVVKLNVPLQMALLKLGAEIASAGARVEYPDLPEVIGDENEISQVFEALLKNALTFRGAETPHVVISAEQGTGQCTISVCDNGLGIDPAFREQALLPFKRLHHSGVSGTGLGLAICQKIVRAHGGRIWIESDGAHGTNVLFTLPA